MRTRVLGLGILATGLWSCAEVGPPPGGPADKTPPGVVTVTPDSAAVNVPTNAPIRIAFTEKVDEKSIERALWVTPGGASKPRIDFKGDAVEIKLGRAFPESTTMNVLITTLLRDRRAESRENHIAKPIHWVFSTGGSIWPGRVRGTLEKVGVQTGQGVVLVVAVEIAEHRQLVLARAHPAEGKGALLADFHPAGRDGCAIRSNRGHLNPFGYCV